MGLERNNSFDALRLVGALIVIVGHAVIISGEPSILIGSVPLQTIGVILFFAISGFLITHSWLSDSNPTRFIARRSLRIFPGLIATVVLTAFVIGPIASTEGLTSYFRHGWTYGYVVLNSLLVTTWSIPSVFEDLPLKGQVNGSLWTLPIEFLLYLAVPALALARRSPITRFLLFFGATSVVYLAVLRPELFRFSFGGVDIGHGIRLAPYFIVGSALRLTDFPNWRRSLRTGARILSMGIVAVWSLQALDHPWLLALAAIPIALLTIDLGCSSTLSSAALQRFGDISYGTYLWAFPIQQLIQLRLDVGPWSNIAIATPVTVVLAFLSWHLIEKPCLRLKPKAVRQTPDGTLATLGQG